MGKLNCNISFPVCIYVTMKFPIGL